MRLGGGLWEGRIQNGFCIRSLSSTQSSDFDFVNPPHVCFDWEDVILAHKERQR